MIKMNFLKIFLFLLVCSFVACDPSSSQRESENVVVNVANKVTGTHIQVVSGSQSQIVEPDACLSVTAEQWKDIAIHWRPEVISGAWIEKCTNNRENCIYKGSWQVVCQAEVCGPVLPHYELKGSLNGDKTWTVSAEESPSCSRL